MEYQKDERPDDRHQAKKNPPSRPIDVMKPADIDGKPWQKRDEKYEQP
jgi:hypothetical protein